MKFEYIGKSSLENIRYIIEEKNYKKILIFAGKKSFSSCGAENELKNILSKFQYEIFFKSSYLPEIADLKKFILKINNFKPNIILAIGGGSVLDLSKVANTLYNCKNIEKAIAENNYKLSKFCELIAIPTTAGSGAEATSNAVTYIKSIKYSVEGKEIKPDYIIIDPNLILSTPKKIAAAAGMDAIAQSIESLLSKKSNNESVKYSIEALRYLLPYYENHINNSNFESAYKMSFGALNAGRAINISKTTAPHAVSYPFTSEYKIDHGHAVAITLTDFLKFNFKNISIANLKFDLNDRYKILFDEFKVKNINELNNKILKIAKNTGLELDLKKLNISKASQIDNILKGINQQRLGNNPIDLDIPTVRKILLSKIDS
tara:strand:- start:498 stop:1622 length:1125 start_codon:yes stop_codon:yes gene_type:complete